MTAKLLLRMHALGARQAQSALDSGDYGYYASNKGMSTLTLIDDYWSAAVLKLPAASRNDKALLTKLAKEYRRGWREHLKAAKNPPPAAWQVEKNGRLDLGKLDKIPREIRGLKSVREISLYGRQSAALDPVVFTLPNVESAYLQRNKLEVAPKGLLQWKRLEKLLLGENPLENIDVLCEIPTLEYLDLSMTKLRQLPADIGALSKLRELDLFHNKLTSYGLPPSFAQLKALRKIRLPPRAEPAFVQSIKSLLPRVTLK